MRKFLGSWLLDFIFWSKIYFWNLYVSICYVDNNEKFCKGFIYQVTEAVRCFENRIFINFLHFSRRQVFHYNFNEYGHWYVCFPQSLPKVSELLVRAFKKEWNLWIALEFMGVFIVLMKLSCLISIQESS